MKFRQSLGFDEINFEIFYSWRIIAIAFQLADDFTEPRMALSSLRQHWA